MKSITRLSLALIMFSLFPISYLVTSVSAQNGTTGTATTDLAPDSMVPPADPSNTASPTGGPGLVPSAETTSSGGITGWLRGIIGKKKPKADLAPPTGK